jgi:hypothetical protein
LNAGRLDCPPDAIQRVLKRRRIGHDDEALHGGHASRTHQRIITHPLTQSACSVQSESTAEGSGT